MAGKIKKIASKTKELATAAKPYYVLMVFLNLYFAYSIMFPIPVPALLVPEWLKFHLAMIGLTLYFFGSTFCGWYSWRIRTFGKLGVLSNLGLAFYAFTSSFGGPILPNEYLFWIYLITGLINLLLMFRLEFRYQVNVYD